MPIKLARGRPLSAHTIDADMVLRERGTAWAALLVALGFLAYLEIHDRVHPHSGGWAINVTFASLLFLSGLVELVLYPPFLTIGPSGITFGYWFRRWRFPWARIDSFALGNPSLPKHAYVMVGSRGGTDPPRAVRLPRLSTHSAIGLVNLLQAKQRLFAPGAVAGAGANGSRGG